MMGTLNQKGFSGDLFKWIFATIAGALIFIFLYRFAFQHVDLSDTLQSRTLVQYLDDHLSALGISDHSSSVINLPAPESLFFQCGSVGVAGYSQDVHKLLFGPGHVDTDRLNVWAEQWSYPFPIADLYYLTTPRTRVLIIYDEASVSFVQKLDVPQGMNVQMIAKKSLKLEDLKQQSSTLDQIHLIYLMPVHDVKTITSSLKGLTVHLVEVDLKTKTLKYHNDQTKMFYLGDAMLYGAFFAPDQYDCLQNKALERFWQAADLMKERALLLRTKTDDAFCKDVLFEASKVLESMMNVDEGEVLQHAMEKLEGQNNLLEKRDCLLVY
jgi:hypothetical protein